MMVTMELMMKERNMFLWRETLWQLRLLEDAANRQEIMFTSFVHRRVQMNWWRVSLVIF